MQLEWSSYSKRWPLALCVLEPICDRCARRVSLVSMYIMHCFTAIHLLDSTQNHDFDYGLENMMKLNSQCNFPWLMANVLDRETGGCGVRAAELAVHVATGERVMQAGLGYQKCS